MGTQDQAGFGGINGLVSIGYEDGYVWLKFILVFCFSRQVILCIFILFLLMPLRDGLIKSML